MERSNNPNCGSSCARVSRPRTSCATAGLQLFSRGDLRPAVCGVRRPAHKMRHRHGKITLVTLFAILGLVVMAGFVGNVGQTVSTKIGAQNAADAVAFSSAQWMARGMNSLTATNHLLGEVTGLCVVIEALGGPEMDAGMAVYTKQNQTLD